MLAQELAIVAPVAICVLVGVLWTRSGQPYDVLGLSRLVTDVGVPCLIVSRFSSGDFPVDLLSEAALASTGLVVGYFIFAIFIVRLTGRDFRTFVPPLVFPNNGNMGMPLALFAFGDLGLQLAIVVFVVTSIIQFTVGLAIVSGQATLRTLYATPLVYAIALGVFLLVTGIQFPPWLQATVTILGDLAIPLMLLTLGVSLGRAPLTGLFRDWPLAVARPVLGFGVGVLVSAIFGLDGAARGVVIIQASMAPAVMNYMLAQRYNRNPEAVGALVVLSTLLVFALSPLLIAYVLR